MHSALTGLPQLPLFNHTLRLFLIFVRPLELLLQRCDLSLYLSGCESQIRLQLHLRFNGAMGPQPEEAVVIMIATAQLAYAHCTLGEEHGADGVVAYVITFGHISDLQNKLELCTSFVSRSETWRLHASYTKRRQR